MRTLHRDAFKRLLKSAGLGIIRYPQHYPGHKRVLLFQHYGIDVVLDVGANDGGYGRELRQFGYAGDIVSFEPLAGPFARLQELASKDGRWATVNVALGSTNRFVQINVAENTSSSSFLPMREAHRRAAPWATYVGTEDVPMTRLDDLFSSYCSNSVPLLKIDVQGYEEHVIDGARLSMPLVRGVQIEMSLVPLYEGAWTFSEVLDRFERHGFELVSLEPGFYDRSTGQLLQADGIFMRP